MVTESEFKSIAEEYLETARQVGKSETSGLVSAIYKTLGEILTRQRRIRENIYLLLIGVLLTIYSISFWYVYTTRVTQDNLDTAVAQAMEQYLELEGYVIE